MGLVEELLKDYGTISLKIGMAFLKCNPISWKKLRNSTDITEIELRNGLAILIQKRFVKYYWMEKEIIYVLDTKTIKRRMFYAHYLNHIKSKLSKEDSEYFKKVLIGGIYKELGESEECKKLLKFNFLQNEMLDLSNKKNKQGISETNKRKKTQGQYVSVNYEWMDKCIYEGRMYEYVCKGYNKATGEIYKAMTKINVIERDSIIENLESTKILLLSQGGIINNKKNIDEYLEYLYLGKVLSKTNGINGTYSLSCDRKILKKYLINLMIEENKYRRVFNMVYDRNGLDDKYISMNSLISVGKISSILLKLECAGLMIQRSRIIQKLGQKMENLWVVDLDYSCNVITNTIELNIFRLLQKYNTMWTNNYFKDNIHGSEMAWISDMIGMSSDCLILNMT